MRLPGSVLILGSAVAFGAMGVFGTLAYDEGVTTGTLLAVRFVLAALVWWAAVVVSGMARELPAMERRDVALALALGACGYAAQAGGYFLALQRLEVSLLALLLYTYPAIVAVSAVALGRERADARKVLALACTSGGLVLVLAGAGTGALDPVGTALGLVTACVYSAYILVSEPVSSRMSPHLLATLVCTGAGVSLLIAAVALGDLRPGAVTAAGWGWLASLSLVSTVAAVALFFAGLRRVGPTSASILSTVEPLVGVVLAALVLEQVLEPVQIAGGLLMLAGIVVLNLRLARSAPATA